MLSLMIVDDEKNVIQGLTHILTKHCPGYRIAGTAQSAEDALHMLQGTPADVVITDVKMPDMDGIELTKKIRELYPHTTVIVLSGYAEFEYVRRAMINGASDYLLKPCHYRTVLEILQKIEEKLIRKVKKKTDDNNKAMLRKALAGQKGLSAEWTTGGELQMAVISTPGYKEPLCEELLCGEFGDGSTEGEALDIVGMDHHSVIVFRRPQEETALKRKLSAFRQQMFKKGYRTCSAVHRFARGGDCLHAAYLTCLDMIGFLQFNELTAVLDTDAYHRHIEIGRNIVLRDYYCSQTLGRYIVASDIGGMRHYIETSLNKLYRLDCSIDPERTKKEILKEIIYLERYLKEHGVSVQQAFERQTDYMRKLAETGTMRQLLGWLKAFTMSIIMNTKKEDQLPHYIHSAVKFIDRHYMEDISLKAVSDAVYLNPWYFSTQFKKYMDVSFSEYLNHVRIRMAKEFLRQRDLKVYQVAEMVGFQDAAYFSTVFKQVEHMSPKEFQKIL